MSAVEVEGGTAPTDKVIEVKSAKIKKGVNYFVTNILC